MKKKIFYILFSLPFISFAQEMDINHHNIKINNYINLESDDLNTSFLNTMLFGGFITDEIKDTWINQGDDNNRLNAELTNSIEYKHSKNQVNFYYFQFADVNLINSSFKDDV